jgi:hypothetical protein
VAVELLDGFSLDVLDVGSLVFEICLDSITLLF